MVAFHDVAVPARQRRRGALHQLVQQGHAEAEVGRPQHRDVTRRLLQRGLLPFGQAGGPRYQRLAALVAQRQHRIKRIRQAEIHRHVELRRPAHLGRREPRHPVHHTLVDTACDRRHHLDRGIICGQAQQRTPHAPGGTVDQESDRIGHGGRLAAAAAGDKRGRASTRADAVRRSCAPRNP